MKNAYRKDIWRSIRKSARRFLSLLVITALGVTVLTGIYAACQDMFLSADRFYDEQELFDVRVLSTLGLTDEDITALQAIEGIAVADGGYNETVHTVAGGIRQTADLAVLSEKGLNRPYVTEGRLPQAAGEVAVTQKYLDASGKSIGDALEIEEDLDAEKDGEDAPPPEAEDAPANTPEDAAPDGGDDGPATDIDWDAEVEIEDDSNAPSILNTRYTITGVVIDPMSISNNEGGTSFRSTATTDYTFFVTADNIDSDVYTSIHLALNGLAAMNCYSDEYGQAVQQVIDVIEAEIMKQRQQARYDAVMAEALAKLADAESTMEDKFAEADELFSDAWAELEDAKRELLDGEATLTREERDALQKLADARAELEDGKAKLRAGEDRMAAGEATLNANAAEIAEGRRELEANRKQAQAGFAAAEQTFADKQADLDAQGALLGQQIAAAQGFVTDEGESWPASWGPLVAEAARKTGELLAADPGADPSATVAAYMQGRQETAAFGAELGSIFPSLPSPSFTIQDAVGYGVGYGIVQGSAEFLKASRAAYETGKQDALARFAAAEAELAGYEAQLEAGRQELANGRAEIASGWAQLAEGEAELNAEEAKALRELADAWQELADGKKELAEGEQELLENEAEYLEKKTEAEQKLADAYAELADIDMAQWYVQDRTSLDSYSALKNDLSSIEAVGNAFPVLFLLVAILISLTTMTRMVEEERGLIGTYKALGLSNGAIYKKYLMYALLASLLGGLLGNLLGFVALPAFLLGILQVMYVVPNTTLTFDYLYGIGGPLLFIVCIVGATLLACRSELRQTPATLMRPKAPRAGARVILERLPVLWNRFSFLNKVTARNLFRYKKRLFMTVAGIMGCTALVLCGFAIKDSVADMLPKQYEQINRYDLMLVADGADNETLLRLAEDEAAIAQSLNVQLENVKVLNAGGTTASMQMMVVPTGAAIEAYIGLLGTGGGEVPLPEGGVLITRNTSELLGLAVGDDVYLQNESLDRYRTQVGGIVENYLGNTVYIAQAVYEDLLGAYQPNALLAMLSLAPGEQPAYAQGLLEHDEILSSVSTQGLKDDFSSNFAMINSVLYLLIVLAAGLAFVVLFTLSNTNISERVRELATIKVLGFYDREVHAYVNKETLILTGIGVLAGLPVGRFLSGLLTQALKMPSVYFAVHIQPASYLIAALLSFSFALIVNLITNRTLDKLDMVEALKSVE